jgi:putative chitinase
MTISKTPAQWTEVLTRCGVKRATAARWAPVFSSVITDDSFSAGASELGDFLGQVLHESGMLERVEEGLTYTSASRLCAVWPRRFPTPADAAPYVRNPEGLANHVYSGRMGNMQHGDGYRFRGRGLLQVTGRDNYTAVGRAIGMDLTGNPDLLAQPEFALRASVAWWEGNLPDSIMDNIVKVTRRVNGGTVGIEHRAEVTQAADRALA